MNKKILLSVAASMLLTTSVFAADELESTATRLLTDTGFNVIAEESYLQNGMDILDLASMEYTAKVDRPGGSISDPMIAINITELEFPYHLVAGVVTPGFDEAGRGMTPIELRDALAQTDLAQTQLEADYFGVTNMDDIDGSGVLSFDQINFEVSGQVYAQYDGSSAVEVKDAHTYQIVDGEIPFKYQRADAGADQTKDGYIGVRLYSQTLDNSAIDAVHYEPDTNFVPQFTVNCVRKFDGLINFENDRVSFVNPEHGERVDRDPATTPNDSIVVSDRIVFEIENARNNITTRWMGGHNSEFRVNASNNDNDFAAVWLPNSTIDIFSDAAQNNVDTEVAGDIAGGTATYVGNTFTFLYPNLPIEPGTTTIEANLATDSSEPIRAVKFTDTVADFEGGLAAVEHTDGTQAVGSLTFDALGYVVNTQDNDTSDSKTANADIIAPQNQTNPMATDAGEWMDHAFIAQIPGATQTDTTQTKLFIVNRSCAPVTPKFRLIKDGVVIEVDGEEIAVDSQQKTTLASIVPEDGQYAVEIIIPGIAEDFYVYAQAQGMVDKTITKDLPVYNTSSRD